MTGANAAEVTPQQSGEASGENGGTVAPESTNVAKFAALLKAERAGEEPVTETTPEPAGSEPKQPDKAPSVDREALLAAFEAGDERKLAELLGKDPRDVKVGNSRFAEFRRHVRTQEEKLEQTRTEIESEKAKIAEERKALQQSTAILQTASKHLQAGDYGSFLEVATGKPLADVLETLTRELVDPSQREIRTMRAEQAERDRKAAEERQQLQQQLQQREAVEARANYMRDLRSELTHDADTQLFVEEYGDEFVAAVFDEQKRAWDGQRTITAQKAVERVLEAQLKKHQRLSGVLSKRTGKTVPTGGDSKQPAVQGNRGARLSSRSVDTTRSQGGASTTPRDLSPQERNAHFAALLRQENVSRT